MPEWRPTMIARKRQWDSGAAIALLLVIALITSGIYHAVQRHQALNESLLAALDAGRSEQAHSIVRLLLQKGASSRLRGRSGTTPLMVAAWAGDGQLFEDLVREGADIHAADEHGYTALMWAAEAGRAGSIRALARLGAELDLREKRGWTAMMLAAREAQPASVEALIAVGANAGLMSESGVTALGYAEWSGQWEAIRLLRAAEGRKSPPGGARKTDRGQVDGNEQRP